MDLMDVNLSGRCGGTIFGYDEGCLTVDTSFPADFYKQISACIGCPMEFAGQVNGKRDFIVNGLYATNISINSCQYHYTFGEAGRYLLNFTSVGECPPIEVLSQPDDPYASIWLLFGFVMVLICFSVQRAICGRPSNFAFVINDLGDVTSGTSTPSESGGLVEPDLDHPVNSQARIQRLVSVDVFRGIAIFLMIVVNAGGGGYWFLQHSNWDGITLADLIFPWFAWIMGMSIVPGVGKHMRLSRSRKVVMTKVIIRSFLIVLLGLVISSKGGPISFSNIRIPGVLQRLGVAYFIVATVQVILLERINYGFTLIQILFSWIFFFTHIFITNYLHVPGCPTGYVGPGGTSDGVQFPNCTGGAAGYIDQVIFSKKHLYSSGPWSSLYSIPGPFDPEGVLGILTTCSLVFSGVIDKHNYSNLRPGRGVAYFITMGLTHIFLGFSLSKFSGVHEGSNWLPGSWMIPINKPLWSPSFVLIALGSAELLFLVFTFLIASFDWKGWHFTSLGRNSILIYLGSVMLGDILPFSWVPFTHGSHMEPLLSAVWAALLWTAIASRLHAKGLYFVV